MAWLTGYSNRKKIDIQTTNIDSNLSDFPLLVKLTADGDVGAVCLATGYDVRFTSSDETTEIGFERESFSVASSQATGIFWVKCSPATTGTSIYMYYGKADATDASVASAPWDANFKAVWHGTTLLDSTGNTTLTAEGNAAYNQASGAVNKCMTFDGTGDYFTAADGGATDINGSNQPLTISAWVNHSSLPGASDLDSIIGKYNTASAQRQYLLHMRNFTPATKKWACTLSNDGTAFSVAYGATTPSTSTWYYVSTVYNDTDIRIYVNGALDSVVSVNPLSYTNGIYDGTGEFAIGGYNSGSYAFFMDGGVCEARLSNTARSAEWIKFEDANMSEADNDLTFNAEEDAPSTSGGYMTTMKGIW